jgi:hypothetical protein
MTDFLKRVAQTALGLMPVVQPLVASRYAPGPHLLPLPEALPTEERPSSPAEQAQQPDMETFLPSNESLAPPDENLPFSKESLPPSEPRSANAPIKSRALAERVANEAQPESRAPLSQAAGPTKSEPPTFPQSTGVSEIASMPFETPAEQTSPLPQRQDRTEPEKNEASAPAEDLPVRVRSADAEPVPVPSRKIHKEGDSDPVVEERAARRERLAAKTERRATETVEVKTVPPREPEAVGSPATAHQEKERSVADESRPRAQTERKSEALRVVVPEPVDPRIVAEDGVERQTSSEAGFARSLSSEPHLEDHELSASSMLETRGPHRSDSRSDVHAFTESPSRPAVAHPRSTQDDEAAEPQPPGRVIRVTIGRIEVRAVTPPLPPVETAAPPAPKLSLDEYLRQHNGRSQ